MLRPGDHRASRRERHEPVVPLPFALGGIGFILALAIPDGLSGGWGFSIGFLLGLALILVKVLREQNRARGE